jgi:hypothetical protein
MEPKTEAAYTTQSTFVIPRDSASTRDISAGAWLLRARKSSVGSHGILQPERLRLVPAETPGEGGRAEVAVCVRRRCILVSRAIKRKLPSVDAASVAEELIYAKSGDKQRV